MSRVVLLADIEKVVAALGEIAQSCVLAGGCAPLYYPRDQRVSDLRPTDDVDLIVPTTTYVEFAHLERKLRERGFDTPDPATGPHPVFRLSLDGKLVDFMPMAPTHGPVNRWYESAVAESIPVPIASLAGLRVIAPHYFVATKLEAFASRGDGDYLASHDIEDVVWCLRAVPGVLEGIAKGTGDVHVHLRGQIRNLLGERAFVESLAGHFEPDAGSQGTIDDFVRRLGVASGLQGT